MSEILLFVISLLFLFIRVVEDILPMPDDFKGPDDKSFGQLMKKQEERKKLQKYLNKDKQ